MHPIEISEIGELTLWQIDEKSHGICMLAQINLGQVRSTRVPRLTDPLDNFLELSPRKIDGF